MSNPFTGANTQSTVETRPAYAGESLYALHLRQANLKKVGSEFRAAVESEHFSLGEKKVLVASLSLLPGVQSAGLEGFVSDDPNVHSDDWHQATGNPTNDRSGTTLGEHVQNAVTSAMKHIGALGQKVKEGLQDFYDARLNWYGNLVKEIDSLMPASANLQGGSFANQQMIAELKRPTANRTYPTPLHRVQVVQNEAVAALMLAESIKTACAAVAKAVPGDERALGRAVDELLKTLRNSASQEGDVLAFRWNSFSGVVTAKLGRSVQYVNLTAADFSTKGITFTKSTTQATPDGLGYGSQDVLVSCRKYAVAAQQVLKTAIGKNNNDIWNAIAAMRVEEDEQDHSAKINGVIALISFSDKVHELIAKTAQQSFYESVFATVKWVDLSIKDAARSQSRNTQ